MCNESAGRNPRFEYGPYFGGQHLRIRATCTSCGAALVGNSDAIQEWRSEHFCASVDGRNPYLLFRNSSWIGSLLADGLDAGRTEFGNIQLFDSSSSVLRIQASHGFDHEFLAYFETVSVADCACGAALENQRPVIVSDVATDLTFGEQSRAMVLRSNVRSVVSTPLLDRSRNLIGILSLHSARPQHFSPLRLKHIDDLIAGFVL